MSVSVFGFVNSDFQKTNLRINDTTTSTAFTAANATVGTTVVDVLITENADFIPVIDHSEANSIALFQGTSGHELQDSNVLIQNDDNIITNGDMTCDTLHYSHLSPEPPGQGDVLGPASATNLAIATYQGTSGNQIQNSTSTITSGDLDLDGADLTCSTLNYSALNPEPYLGGDVEGPASSTDNSIVIFQGTSGTQIIESTATATIDPATSDVTLAGDLHCDTLYWTDFNPPIPSGPAGTGDVAGPGASSTTDNSVARFNGTTGKSIDVSLAYIDDTGNLTTPNLLSGLDGTWTFMGRWTSGVAPVIPNLGGTVAIGCRTTEILAGPVAGSVGVGYAAGFNTVTDPTQGSVSVGGSAGRSAANYFNCVGIGFGGTGSRQVSIGYQVGSGAIFGTNSSDYVRVGYISLNAGSGNTDIGTVTCGAAALANSGDGNVTFGTGINGNVMVGNGSGRAALGDSVIPPVVINDFERNVGVGARSVLAYGVYSDFINIGSNFTGGIPTQGAAGTAAWTIGMRTQRGYRGESGLSISGPPCQVSATYGEYTVPTNSNTVAFASWGTNPFTAMSNPGQLYITKTSSTVLPVGYQWSGFLTDAFRIGVLVVNPAT